MKHVKLCNGGVTYDIVYLMSGVNKSENTDIIWNYQSTKLLLSIRFSMDKQFDKPQKKKKQLWADVAKKMANEGKYTVSGTTCDNKFRTLMTTYRRCKDRAKETGAGAIKKWPYFEIIDRHYGVKQAVNPHPSLLGSSLQEENKTTNKQNNSCEKKTEDTVDDKTQENGKIQAKVIDLEHFKKQQSVKRERPVTTAELYKKRMKWDMERYERDTEKKYARFSKRDMQEERKIEAIDRMTSVLEKIVEKLN